MADPHRRVDLLWAASMIAAIAVILAILVLLRGVGLPVLLAAAGAYVWNPAVRGLTKRGLSRGAAVAVIYVSGFLLIALGLTFLVPALVREGAKLPESLGRAVHIIEPYLAPFLGEELPRTMDEAVKELGALAVSNAPTAASLFGRVASIAGALVALLWVVLVPLLTFFFLRDYENIIAFCRELIPPGVRPRVLEHLHAVDRVLSGFVRGELIAGAILTSLYWLGWGICGLDLALAVAAIAGFGVMIPYVGPTVGFLLALTLSVTQMQSGWIVLEVAVVFAVVQALDASVISPRVVGERVGLPAVVVILAVLVFGSIFGFVGALTAVPITAILKVVAKVLLDRYRYSDTFAAAAGPVAVPAPPLPEASEKKTAGR